jgi:hypothetical protein
MAFDRIEELQALLRSRSISGFAFISHNGCVECTYGDLEDELWPTDQPPNTRSGPSELTRQIVSAFNGASAPPTFFTVAGKRLIVVRSEDAYVYAIAKHSEIGISLHYLSSGILVVSFTNQQQRSIVGQLHETLR